MEPTSLRANPPSVSVVIPTYNRASLIGNAIRSVLKQTVRPQEIIVVDDGSTDETEEIVRSLESPVPIVYRRETNKGPAEARNVGVALAHGEWVAFLDSDDEWNPEKLELQLGVAAERDTVPFIYSGTELITKEGAPLYTNRVMGALDRVFFGRHSFPPFPSTVVLRRQVFLELGGFNPALRFGEDLELFSRIAARYAIGCVPEPLVKYRCHEGQTEPQTMRESSLLLLELLMNLVRNDPSKRAMVSTQLFRFYADQGKRLMLEGRIEKAHQYFRKAYRVRPLDWKNLRRWALSAMPGVARRYIGWTRRTMQRGEGATLRPLSPPFVICPACGFCRSRFPMIGCHTEDAPFFRESYVLYRCLGCETEFALPRVAAPPESYIAQHEYYGWRWEFDLCLEDLAHHRRWRSDNVPVKILEIGCGEGILLERISPDAEAWGVEFNSAAVCVARSKGLRVHEGDIATFRVTCPDAKFDLINFFQVLEHLPDPWKFLSELRGLLRRDGQIAFSVPNPDRYAIPLGRELWDFPPQHLTRFSKKGLTLLLKRAGFDVVRLVDRPTTETDVGLGWRLLYQKVPLPKRVRQVFKLPLRLTLTPIAKMVVNRCTGQDLYVLARPTSQDAGKQELASLASHRAS